MPCLGKKEIANQQSTDKYARSAAKEGRSHSMREPLASPRLRQRTGRVFLVEGMACAKALRETQVAYQAGDVPVRVRAPEQ